ncbi:MAG: hypothetical protein JWM09_881 [Francisellaceae bacterium]|nr:hypothetical protein [Francisellaceae bacterium]
MLANFKLNLIISQALFRDKAMILENLYLIFELKAKWKGKRETKVGKKSYIKEQTTH